MALVIERANRCMDGLTAGLRLRLCWFSCLAVSRRRRFGCSTARSRPRLRRFASLTAGLRLRLCWFVCPGVGLRLRLRGCGHQAFSPPGRHNVSPWAQAPGNMMRWRNRNPDRGGTHWLRISARDDGAGPSPDPETQLGRIRAPGVSPRSHTQTRSANAGRESRGRETGFAAPCRRGQCRFTACWCAETRLVQNSKQAGPVVASVPSVPGGTPVARSE